LRFDLNALHHPRRRSKPIAKTLVYTITPGRSGTNFLANLLRENLPDAQVHHERAWWFDFGVNCPDVAHLTRFNNLGNQPFIQNFWKQKLERDASQPQEIYAEATHLHAKAGLVENLNLVPKGTRVVLVAQKRDPFKIVWSLHNRMDFRNFGFTWIWSLDSRYHNVIVQSKTLKKHGVLGNALWYVIEMQARAAYYRLLTAEMDHVDFLDTSLEEITTDAGAKQLLECVTGTAPEEVKMPPPANELGSALHFGAEEKEKVQTFVSRIAWDAEDMALKFFNSGRRLATPPPMRTQT